PDELDTVEQADAADLANRRMLLRQRRQELVAQNFPHRGGVFDDALLAQRLDRRDTSRARKRMARVREAAGEVAVEHPFRELLVDDHRAEWDVARVDPLGAGHDVW